MFFFKKKHQRKKGPGYIITLILILVLLLLPAAYTLITRITSAEATIVPIANWKFDEGYGTSTYESISNSNTGTLAGTTVPTWQTEDKCVAGKCLYFDGSTSKVTIAGTASFKSVSMWVRPISVSSAALADFGSNVRITVSSGVVSASGFTSPTIYIDGQANTTLVANKWQHVSVTTGTTVSGASMQFGTYSTTYLNGYLDDIRMYTDEQPASVIKGDFTARNSARTVAAQMGQASSAFLNQGLVGYWKLEESATPAVDSSGNAQSGTWTSSPTQGSGKFGFAITLVSASSQYITVSDSAALSTTGQVTLSAWINPTTDIISRAIIVKDSAYRMTTNASSQLVCEIYSGGAWQTAATSTSTLVAGTWQHTACTFDGTTIKAFVNSKLDGTSAVTAAINDSAAALEIGRNVSTNYFNGSVDETRIYNRALAPAEVGSLYNWAPGPFAHWKFDDNTGTSVADASGNANTGTWAGTTGAQWIPGKYGSAGNFNGSDNYVTTSNNNSMKSLSQFTIEAWIKPTTLNSTAYNIYSESINASGQNRIQLAINSSTNRILFGGKAPDSNAYTTWVSSTSTYPLTAGVWQHIAATYNADTDTANVYVNGLRQTASITLANIDSTNPFRVPDIGADANNSSVFKGQIDDVRLYNYERTSGQVIEDMNGGHPLGGSPIGSQIINWRFDEGYGTTAYNAVDSGTDGTLTNMASPATSTSGWTNVGKINKAVVFDGTNNQVTIATASDSQVDFNGTEAFSGCAWVYSTTMAGSGEKDLIIGKWDATTPTRAYRLFLTNDNADTTGNFGVEMYDESADQTLSATDANDTVSQNTWYHVCFTFDGGTAGAANDLKLYVNGNLKASNTANASFLGVEDVTADFTVGDYDATDVVAADTAFTGKIDEVQMYSAALSSDSIKVARDAGSSAAFGGVFDPTTEESDVAGSAGNPPLAYLNFNENTGTTANDISGNTRSGTLTVGASGGAARYQPGKIGSGVYLSPNNTADTNLFWAYVALPNDTLDSLTSGTVEFWFKPDGNTEDTGQEMFYIGDNSDGAANAIEFNLDLSTNKFSIWAVQASSLKVSAVGTNAIPNPTGWHHLVYTSTSSSNIVYIDGVVYPMTYSTGTSATQYFFNNASTGTTYYRLGCTSTGATSCDLGDQYWGMIDELKVYDYVRTPAQVAYDYNRGKPTGLWKLDDCTGSTAYDTSGKGNNGTITIGASGSQTAVGTCSTSGAWFNGANGKYNASLNFDGTDDYVDLGDLAYTESASQLSVSFWIKPNTLTTSDFFVEKGNGVGTQLSWGIGTSGSFATELFASIATTTTDTTTNCYITGALSNSVWQHIVMVFDGTLSGNTNRLKFFINGVQKTISGCNGTIPASTQATTSNVTLGTTSDHTATTFYNGQLDDFRIYNYPLSSAQVNKIYNDDAAVKFAPVTGSP